MTDFDTIVIGAGAAGICAAGLLAREGQNVMLVEASPHLGGRGLAVDDQGFRVSLGGHLMEDPGSGLVRIAAELGHQIERGPISSDLAVWDHEAGRWGSIRDRYRNSNRDELAAVIDAIVSTPYADFDDWDDRPLRDWITQHTTDPGVIDMLEFITVLECMTERWYDHSASDNLYVRKLHYTEARKAGFSFWPVGGWDGMWTSLADAAKRFGADIVTGRRVNRVIVHDHKVSGVALASRSALPNAVFDEDVLTADAVISTLPVWNVLDILPLDVLPEWYIEQIRFLAQDKFRMALLGLQIAVEDPCPAIDRLELSTWLRTPSTTFAGFLFEQTAMDPATAPPGCHLYVMGAVVPPTLARDRAWARRSMALFEEDMKTMYPGFRHEVWQRRSLVLDPPFGVVQMPGLVGRYRPHWRAPNVEGLWFASETFRSRMIGTDRAARAALTVVEEMLGRRLWPLAEGWRY
jgi:phytoene dehydrogenase-like protein